MLKKCRFLLSACRAPAGLLSRNHWGAVGLVILIAFAFSPALLGQDTPDLQAASIQKVLERLDRLEKQNQELLAEIHELRKELSATGTAAPLPTPPVAERLDVQEARTAELAQSKVDTSQHMPVSLTGMVLFNAFHNGEYGGALQYPFTASAAPSGATAGATLRQTVLGLKFNGPDLPGGGKASGSFYMDFWGGTSAASNNLFRIRVATLDLAWKNTTITVGQDKPIMSPRDPTSLAQVSFSPLSGAGNLWLWQPQSRIEQRISFGENSGLRAQAGIYETSETYPAKAPAAFASSLGQIRPAYQGRFDFYHGPANRRFEIAPGFSFSQTHVAGTSVPSRLGTLDWLARPEAWIEFTGAFFHGENAQGFGGLRQGYTILSTPDSVAVSAVHVNGGWAQIALFPASRLSFHLYGGEEHDQNAALSPGAISRNLAYAGNLIYKLAPNVLAALEISQNRTAYIASGERLNNHYDLALAYLF